MSQKSRFGENDEETQKLLETEICSEKTHQSDRCSISMGETLDSVSTVFNEIAQHPPHSLFAICNWSIGHPR